MSGGNKSKKGGDMKSIKYSGLKNGSFLTDFFPKMNEKNSHLLEKEVRESDAQIKTTKMTLEKLKSDKKDKITKRSEIAVKRCELDDSCPGWYNNPSKKEHMQLSLDWINNKEELIDIDEEIDKTRYD